LQNQEQESSIIELELNLDLEEHPSSEFNQVPLFETGSQLVTKKQSFIKKENKDVSSIIGKSLLTWNLRDTKPIWSLYNIPYILIRRKWQKYLISSLLTDLPLELWNDSQIQKWKDFKQKMHWIFTNWMKDSDVSHSGRHNSR